MSFTGQNPYVPRFNGQTAARSPKRLALRLSRPLSRKEARSTHWAFEGTTTPACGRKGWSKVPRTTREPAEVTCRGCCAVVAKVVAR